MFVKETEFPHMEIKVMDPDTNTVVDAEIPYGNGRAQCRRGCRRALPYLDWEAVSNLCGANEPFRTSCCHFSDIVSGDAPEFHDPNERVETREGAQERLIALYDGHTAESYAGAHQGAHPEKVGLTPCRRVHPETLEHITLYFQPGDPPFRLGIADYHEAEHQRHATPMLCHPTTGHTEAPCHAPVQQN